MAGKYKKKMIITNEIAGYINKKAVNLSAIARDTKIPYSSLYASLANKARERPLTVDEAVLICEFLGVGIEDFVKKTKTDGALSPPVNA